MFMQPDGCRHDAPANADTPAPMGTAATHVLQLQQVQQQEQQQCQLLTSLVIFAVGMQRDSCIKLSRQSLYYSAIISNCCCKALRQPYRRAV